jgi:hypothetical protein
VLQVKLNKKVSSKQQPNKETSSGVPENGGNTSLRNNSKLPPDYTASHAVHIQQLEQLRLDMVEFGRTLM